MMKPDDKDISRKEGQDQQPEVLTFPHTYPESEQWSKIIGNLGK